MSLQFSSVALLLVVLIFLGLMSHNGSITIAAAVLLLMQQTFLAKYLPFVEQNGLSLGIIILTIGVLAPIVTGKVQIPSNLGTLLNWKLLLSLGVGMLVAWLGGRGINLMSTQPILLTGLMIGTVLGVAFLGGVPVGPLIAAGILSLLLGVKQ